MYDYVIEPGQRVIVRPNTFNDFKDLTYQVLCLGDIISTDEGVLAKDCTYEDKNKELHYVTIPLVLLWRIADDESLLEWYETTLIKP